MIKTTVLCVATALCAIIGCFRLWLCLQRNASIWMLIPAGISLALFVWLLTLHPAASGRVYAAYGGVYVCTALMWLRVVDGVKLTLYDWTAAWIALCVMLIIVAGWERT
ncbi:YnfA family protein [Escherichia coli]|nr:YnfA family protein [Escherichia coli]